MTQRRAFIGIDFGTSNSSIAYVLPDPRDKNAQKVVVKTVQVVIDAESGAKSERIPTILGEQPDKRRRGTFLLGWDFIQTLLRPKRKGRLLRHGENFFQSVKSDLGTFRVYAHAFAPEYNTPEKVTTAIFARLLKEAERSLPEYNLSKARVIVSVPASLSAIGRRQTLDAAAAAGLKPDKVELIDEPVAALLDFLNDGRAAGLLDTGKPKNILVFDYGGGTLDLSLVRASFDPKNKATGLRVENLAISQYRRLGGDDIDRAVMRGIVWPQIEACAGIQYDMLGQDIRQKIEDTLTHTVARQLKEGICRKITDAGKEKPPSRRSRNLKFVADLSTVFDEDIKLPRHFEITANELEAIMEPFVASPQTEPSAAANTDGNPSLMLPILGVLARAGISELDLDAVLLHGGSCKNPFVRELLIRAFCSPDTLFGNVQILETPDLDASVAKGAAIAAYWRHERGIEMVPPIIAEEIGILTLDDKPVRLLKSGTPLPFPNEDGVYMVPAEFYVPRQGQRQMLVPFYSGQHARQVNGSVLVDLPANVKRGTPVAIKLRVERDKTLHWWFSIDGGAFMQAQSIEDAWSIRIPSPTEKKLLVLRRDIRDILLRTGSVPIEMERLEGSLLYRCRRLEEAELVLQDIIRHHGIDAGTANILGLVSAENRSAKAALEWHRKAVELNPKDAIYMGNYGFMLADAGELQLGEAKIREALGLNPNLKYLYARLGDLYRLQGDEPRAKREYQEAIRLALRESPSEDTASRFWREVAGLYQRTGEYQNAREARERAERLLKNERLGGDHELRIAGPDSGFIPLTETAREI